MAQIYILFLILFLHLVLDGGCQENVDNSTGYNFQTYEIFKVESTYAGDNTACDCTVDASVSGHEWNEWSRCQGHQKSFQCHRGIQYRWRPCSSTSERNQCKQREWKYCYNERSCTGEWQSWTNAADGGICSHSCGGGVRLKVRACVKNNEIGLFCAGKNRSPYGIKKEPCNSQKCPAWSEWTMLTNNCTDENSEDGTQGLTYVRSCLYNGKIATGCDGDNSQNRITRRCDEAPLSFPVSIAEPEKNTGVPNNTTTTYVLVAIIGILIVILFIFCGRLCSTTHRKLTQDKKPTTISPTADVGTEKSNSFVASRILGPGRFSRKPKWKTPENYEEIVLDNEPIHGSFAARVAGLTAPTLALPAIPPPLRGSFQDISQFEHKGLETYTIMAGSPTSTVPTYTQKIRPERVKSRRQSTPPLPKRNFSTDESLRPVPVDIAFDGSAPSSSNKLERRNTNFTSVSVDSDAETGHLYLESRSLTRSTKNKKKRDKDVKRRKSEDYGARKQHKSRRENDSTVSRENSVGFSRLHSSTREDTSHSSLSHLYAEIHDNTRF
ncbi:uncharacterized protein LOC120327928 [Styela clava]|uniref:uncharacterized protein LOC120327928 n=1 Tax=Styela clava TaxID=7725 RepID=UPI0019393ECF|nr:uncharacterized protein LOC120327928 [Styela clava]